MNIKQKKYFVVFLIIILAIAGLSIWLMDRSNGSSNYINKKITVELGSCEEVAPHYVGISESQASDKAKKENRSYRVVSRDGEGLPVNLDYGPGRLNFEVQKGVVTKATCG